jgi:hypothetical protein
MMRRARGAVFALVVCGSLLALAGCGGGGGGGGGEPVGSVPMQAPVIGSDGRATFPSPGYSVPGVSDAPRTVDITPPPPPPPTGATGPARLFMNYRDYRTATTSEGIALFTSGALPAGTQFVPDRLVSVSHAGPPIAYDAGHDVLYVASRSFGVPKVLVFARASNMDAGSKPDRSIDLPAGVDDVAALQVDAPRDVLYVGFRSIYLADRIFVFDNASAASGAVQPRRAWKPEFGVSNMVIDTSRWIAYVADRDSTVHVFTGIDTRDGALAAERTFRSSRSAGSMAVDPARDRLYVASVQGDVAIVEHASEKPDGSIDDGVLHFLNAVPAIAFDAANDRLYVVSLESLYAIDHASQLVPGAAINTAPIKLWAFTTVTGFGIP